MHGSKAASTIAIDGLAQWFGYINPKLDPALEEMPFKENLYTDAALYLPS